MDSQNSSTCLTLHHLKYCLHGQDQKPGRELLEEKKSRKSRVETYYLEFSTEKYGHKKGTALVEPSLQHNHENTILIRNSSKKGAEE